MLLDIDILSLALVLILGIPVVYYDLRDKIIPNLITYSGMAVGFVILFLFRRSEIVSFALAFLLSFGVFYVLYMFGWIGGGDVKLIGMIAILMGAEFLISTLIYMAIAGGIIALIQIGIKIFRKEPLRGTYIPYGTAIMAGCYCSAFHWLTLHKVNI